MLRHRTRLGTRTRSGTHGDYALSIERPQGHAKREESRPSLNRRSVIAFSVGPETELRCEATAGHARYEAKPPPRSRRLRSCWRRTGGLQPFRSLALLSFVFLRWRYTPPGPAGHPISSSVLPLVISRITKHPLARINKVHCKAIASLRFLLDQISFTPRPHLAASVDAAANWKREPLLQGLQLANNVSLAPEMARE